MDAQDKRVADSLVKKLNTPPFDPEAELVVKPTSYDKLTEIADDLSSEGENVKAKWSERGQALWDSVGKKK